MDTISEQTRVLLLSPLWRQEGGLGCSPCPARQLPSCRAESPRPAHAARSPGCRCRTRGPGRAPWMPCGLAQRMPTSLAVPDLHLWARTRGVRGALRTHPPPPSITPLLSPAPSTPLPRVGICSGRLMMPTRSSRGTRERRMARIRRASPLPAWISWSREVDMSLGSLCPVSSLPHSIPS